MSCYLPGCIVAVAIAVTSDARAQQCPTCKSWESERCADVLSLTGRESRSVSWSSQGKAFKRWLKDSSKKWNIDAQILVEEVPLGISLGESSDSREEEDSERQWNDNYFSDAQTVFGPAISAWIDCIKTEQAARASNNGAEAKVRYVRETQTWRMSIFQRANPKIAIELDPGSLKCVHAEGGSQIVLENSLHEFTLGSDFFEFSCVRKPGHNTAETQVTVRVAGADPHVYLIPKNPDTPPKNSEEVLSIFTDKSCVPGLPQRIAPANYDRNVDVRLTMKANWGPGSTVARVTAKLNGAALIVSDDRRRPPDANYRGGMSREASFILPAFVPAYLTVEGRIIPESPNEWGCETLEARVTTNPVRS